MSFRCFDNKRHRWINGSIDSCGLEAGSLKGRVTRARIRVWFEHDGFKQEVVERVMEQVRKLAEETGLRALEVTFDTDDDVLSENVVQILMDGVKEDKQLAGIEVKSVIKSRAEAGATERSASRPER